MINKRFLLTTLHFSIVLIKYMPQNLFWNLVFFSRSRN